MVSVLGSLDHLKKDGFKDSITKDQPLYAFLLPVGFIYSMVLVAAITEYPAFTSINGNGL